MQRRRCIRDLARLKRLQFRSNSNLPPAASVSCLVSTNILSTLSGRLLLLRLTDESLHRHLTINSVTANRETARNAPLGGRRVAGMMERCGTTTHQQFFKQRDTTPQRPTSITAPSCMNSNQMQSPIWTKARSFCNDSFFLQFTTLYTCIYKFTII